MSEAKSAADVSRRSTVPRFRRAQPRATMMPIGSEVLEEGHEGRPAQAHRNRAAERGRAAAPFARGAAARLPVLQGTSAARLSAKARGSYALLRLPRREQQRFPDGAALNRRQRLDRGEVGLEIRDVLYHGDSGIY